MPKKKLTGKRAAFVREYLKDFNATQAATRAGYSAKTAKQTGHELLTFPDVQAAITEQQQKRSERLEVTVDDIVREYARIAFSNIRNYLTFGADGVTIKESSELSEAQLAAIVEVSEKQLSEFDSKRTITVKLHSKTTALESLGRHLGMFSEKLEIKLQSAVEEMLQGVRPRMTPDAYAQLVRAVQAEMGLGDLAAQGAEGSDSSRMH